ncbi:hypothetical protein ACFWHR_07635 [Leucobacter sp. NPDC058333]|uniref:hypothetical protein n=1 Tax=Leucobacter sp. NPDC058333 TaxID=3346450 RepID=UPI0036589346
MNSGAPKIRYSAQRIGTNDWLHFDLPLEIDGAEYTLSGYEVVDATISPERFEELAEDGYPVLWKWGTWIHMELPGGRDWTGIVEDVWGEGSKLRIKIREWLGYLDGLTFTSTLWGINSDPAGLVTSLFKHVGSFPHGLKGVEVVGSTPTRVGTQSDNIAADRKTQMESRKSAWEAYSKPRKELENKVKKISRPYDRKITLLNRERRVLSDSWADAVAKKLGSSIVNARKALVTAKDEQIKVQRDQKESLVGVMKARIEDLSFQETPLKEAFDAAKSDYDAAKKQAQEDGGAWKVLAEDTPDCWKVLQDLAAAGPFDFTTETEYSDGAPILRLHLHYPALSHSREDLVFELGQNISEMPQVEVPVDYASEVIVLGAGEGSGDDTKTLRESIAVEDPRLRRNEVFSDPSITKRATLRAVGRNELRRLRAPVLIPEITVRGTDNVQIGAWSLGDIITVRLRNVPHFGRVVVKHRIRSWKRVGTNKAIIRLEPLDG